jgi:hypothetical protein
MKIEWRDLTYLRGRFQPYLRQTLSIAARLAHDREFQTTTTEPTTSHEWKKNPTLPLLIDLKTLQEKLSE